mgnify:CR=1 FL=1
MVARLLVETIRGLELSWPEVGAWRGALEASRLVRVRPEGNENPALATGEADDKAGAYAIQGRAGRFVVELRGSYSGVMGLPLYETALLLERLVLPERAQASQALRRV